MSDEKTMYLAQWKDQEKFPDFEPILIEILEKLEKLEQELQKTREQLEKADKLIKMLPISCDIYTERIRSEYFKDKDKQGE